MIAMLVFVTASMAALPLIARGMTMQGDSRNSNMVQALVRAQVEELRGLPTSDLRLSVGGNLTSNVANHFNQVSGTPFTRRWTVAAGPTGTLDIVATVVSNNVNVRIPAFQFQLLRLP